MQSSVGIRERIDHVYPSLRPAERAVAQYIRNHIEEAAPDVYLEVQHPCWSCNSNSSSANASAGVR